MFDVSLSSFGCFSLMLFMLLMLFFVLMLQVLLLLFALFYLRLWVLLWICFVCFNYHQIVRFTVESIKRRHSVEHAQTLGWWARGGQRYASPIPKERSWAGRWRALGRKRQKWTSPHSRAKLNSTNTKGEVASEPFRLFRPWQNSSEVLLQDFFGTFQPKLNRYNRREGNTKTKTNVLCMLVVAPFVSFTQEEDRET